VVTSPVDDPNISDDELVTRRVSEFDYVFDGNIGRIRPKSNAFLQDGRDGQTSVHRLSKTTPAAVHALGPEPYLATATVGLLRRNGLGIIYTPKTNEPGHSDITGHKGANLLRRVARQAYWEQGYSP
jgi:hypothetical protein